MLCAVSKVTLGGPRPLHAVYSYYASNERRAVKRPESSNGYDTLPKLWEVSQY